MCSSSSVSTFLPLHIPRKNRLFLAFSHQFPILNGEVVFSLKNPKKRRLVSLSASITRDNLEVSWVSSDRRDGNDYNGWAILEETVTPKKHKKGLPKFLLFGIGTSIVALLAVLAHFTLSRKGYVLRFSTPFHIYVDKKSEDASKVDEVVMEPLMEKVLEEVDKTAEEVIDHVKRANGKPGRVVVPVSADATQQEALLWLKNLKIIEDEVKPNILCSRREFARWLVLLNSRLERNPKNKIVPFVALAGTTINAFDDIKVEDPDFVYIQALAEAGVVLSKLSDKNSTSDLNSSEISQCVNFFPERFISREDLIGWRAKLEYEALTGLNEESRY